MNYYRSGHSEFISRATEIVVKNLRNEQFGVSELAEELNLSQAGLYRRIKALRGVGSNRFIARIRLETAVKLLKESELNISEIALECGFNSFSYFSKCFREKYGYPPGKLRSDPVLLVVKSSRLHNVPVQITPFIDRSKKADTIAELLNEHHIVSLVGAGGCGKTRLACEVAVAAETSFADGIWFIDLVPVEKGDMVIKEVAEALGIHELPGQDMAESIAGHIREKQMLVILDNCEHLLEACAEVAAGIARAGNSIRILATSRTVLNINGEKVWRVPSLSLADPEAIRNADEAISWEAIHLFTDRAKLSIPEFELTDSNVHDVALICKKADGIPLAIEMLASQIRYLEPAGIVEKLSHGFAGMVSHDPDITGRHKTVKATIDWSYGLLNDKEKRLFRRLSIFTGSFNLGAAEKVCCNASITKESLFETLALLVDRSMVNTVREDGRSVRYYLPETLRCYGTELLEEKEAEELRKRHYSYYRDFAEKAFRERMTNQMAWMEKLRTWRDNLLAALNWAEQNDSDLFAGLAGALAWYWVRSKNLALAQKTLKKALSSGIADEETKARILHGYAWAEVTIDMKKAEEAIQMLNESRDIRHRTKNRNEEAVILADLALLYFGAGDDTIGFGYAREAYRLAQVGSDPGVLLYCMIPVSQGHTNLKHFSEARAMAAKVQQAGEETGNLFAQFTGYHNRADCALMEGKYKEAEKNYLEGLEIISMFGDMHYIFIELTGVAMSLSGQGRYKEALRITGAVDGITQKLGMGSPEYFPLSFWQEMVKKHLTGLREKLGEQKAGKYEDEGKGMSLEDVTGYASDIGYWP